MSTLILDDAFVSIDGVDLSDHVKSVSLSYAGQMQDATAMGLDTLLNKGGIKEWSLSVEFLQDYASGKVDATLFDLVGAAAVAIIVRADNTAGVGATNPNYQGNAVLESYPPIAGGVGELAMASVELKCAGTLTRATS